MAPSAKPTCSGIQWLRPAQSLITMLARAGGSKGAGLTQSSVCTSICALLRVDRRLATGMATSSSYLIFFCESFAVGLGLYVAQVLARPGRIPFDR